MCVCVRARGVCRLTAEHSLCNAVLFAASVARAVLCACVCVSLSVCLSLCLSLSVSLSFSLSLSVSLCLCLSLPLYLSLSLCLCLCLSLSLSVSLFQSAQLGRKKFLRTNHSPSSPKRSVPREHFAQITGSAGARAVVRTEAAADGWRGRHAEERAGVLGERGGGERRRVRAAALAQGAWIAARSLGLK